MKYLTYERFILSLPAALMLLGMLVFAGCNNTPSGPDHEGSNGDGETPTDTTGGDTSGNDTTDVGGGETTAIYDFDDGTAQGWTLNDPSYELKEDFFHSGSYSLGAATMNSAHEAVAFIEPEELGAEGNQLTAFSFYYRETTDNTGAGIRLLDNSGDMIIAAASGNPNYNTYGSGGFKAYGKPSSSDYEVWVKVQIAFDWEAGTADITFTDTAGDASETHSVDLAKKTGIKRIEIADYHNPESGFFPGNSGAFYYWMDDVSFTTGDPAVPDNGEDPGDNDNPGPPEETGFGPPSTWAQATTLTSNASGPSVTFMATLVNKDGSQQQISATAQAGQRVRATDQNGNLTKVSVREFTDGCTALENMYVDQSGNADLRNVELVLNESSPRSLFSGDIDLIARTRWPFWHHVPETHPVDKSLVPPFGAGAENVNYLGSYQNALTKSYNTSQVQNIGLFYKAMGTTGGRPDLGLLTKWDVAYLKNPGADNAKMLRGQGDAAAAWSMHALDPNTNMMVKVTDHPKLDVRHANRPHSNPAEWASANTPFSLSQARAHAPTFGFLQALVFQTEFDIEETQYWANYLATLSDHYRLNGGAGIQNVYHSQTRGYGWSLRQTVQAAVISQKFDTPFKDYFALLVDQYGDEINGIMDKRIANNQIRILHKTIYPPGPVAYAIGPWQYDFVGMSVGYGAYLGFDKLETAFMKFGEFFTQRINATPHELASPYDIAVRRTKKANGPLVADWQEAIDVSAGYGYNYFKEATQYPEGSLELNQVINSGGHVSPGALAGYPASNMSYAAYYGAVLGFTKYFGVNGADAAWQTYNDNLIMDYSDNPMFFIDPEVAQQRRPR